MPSSTSSGLIHYDLGDVIGIHLTSPVAAMAARALWRPLRWAAASAGAVSASVAQPGGVLRPARTMSIMGTEIERLERDAVVEDALRARASTSSFRPRRFSGTP